MNAATSRLARAIHLAAWIATCCAPAAESLDERSIRSELFGKQMRYCLLRPPWAGAPSASDPVHVVYLLHGYGSDHMALEEAGLAAGFLEGMRAGRIPKVLLVMPDGERGFYINWHDGTHPYEDYILKEVLPAAEREALGGLVERSRRHIVGVSMGGTGALQIGLRHPELFASTASLSGVILAEQESVDVGQSLRALGLFTNARRVWGDGTDREFLVTHNAYSIVRGRGRDPGLDIFLAAGTYDPDLIRGGTARFHAFLEGSGVRHRYVLYDGDHSWFAWAPIIEEAIREAVAPR